MPLFKSMLGRIRAFPRRSFPLRLTFWTLLVTGSAGIPAALAVGCTQDLSVISGTAYAMASAAFFAYSLANLVGNREVRWMATSCAFGAIGTASVLNAGRNFPSGHEIFGALAELLSSAGAVILACAGLSHGKLSRAGLRLAIAIIPMLVLAAILFRSEIGTAVVAAGYTSWGGRLALVASLAGASALVAVCNGQRYMQDGDRLAGLLAYWAVTAAVSAGFVWLEMLFPNCVSWQPETLDCLAALILVVGLGVENAIAQQQSAEQLDELECLHSISWSLVGAGNSRSLIMAFASSLCEKLEGRFSAVYLLDEQNRKVVTAAVYGLPEAESLIGKSYDLGPQARRGFHTGHTARALASGEIQVVEDIASDVEFVPWRVVAEHNGYVASVPLIDASGTIGAFNIYFDESCRMTGSRLRLLKTVAAAAAPAIRNAIIAEEGAFSTHIFSAA